MGVDKDLVGDQDIHFPRLASQRHQVAARPRCVGQLASRASADFSSLRISADMVCCSLPHGSSCAARGGRLLGPCVAHYSGKLIGIGAVSRLQSGRAETLT